MITSDWNRYLTFFKSESIDVYFSENYCKLYETESAKALAFVYLSGSDCFIFPFLLSQIPCADRLFDFETPYGYGGPLCSTDDPVFLCAAWERFKAELVDRNIVAGFVRFHPILRNHRIIPCEFTVLEDRKTVAIDLMPTEEEIWSEQIHSKNRNVIRKAKASGLRYEIDEDLAHLQDFRHIYDSTMDKLSADSFYYFTEEYYRSFRLALKGRSFLAMVWNEDVLASAALILLSEKYGNYHLAGSDSRYLVKCPNNLLLWETALVLKKMGKTSFYLGGGTDGESDNSLLAFKRKFSNFEHQFYIGKIVLMGNEYSRLCKEWEAKYPEKISRFGRLTLRYRY